MDNLHHLVASPADIDEFPDPSQPLPPPALLQGDPTVTQLVRQRLAPKFRLARLLHSPSRTRRKSTLNEQHTPVEDSEPPSLDPEAINLDNTALIDHDIHEDRYEWAVLYENQRGITAFSIPYYSKLSLLPSDPSPFTLPNTSGKRSNQPLVTLDNYPLPDGNWHWVSRCWMIDMRSDSAEVQHDGFEYNWMFRRHNWRPQVGSFNSGGWVRRRRWVRLMVRPAKQKTEDNELGTNTPTTDSTKGSERWRNRYSMGSSFPPSVLTGQTNFTNHWAFAEPDDVWIGNDPEADWQRCRSLMKRFGRDGRKLELWRLWLGFHHPEHKAKFLEPDDKGKRRLKQWTEDDSPMPSEIAAMDILSREYVSIAPREHVVAVLRIHGQNLLHLFVFPESRVQFLTLLGQAGLLPELNVGLGIGFGSTEIDFWSYASGLGNVSGIDKMLDMKVAHAVAGEPNGSSPSVRSVVTT
ncbi:hypothetical protein B0H34DRAFT_45161 [Crassisporium funariophilum]|nr:hypothetical protein B0H34DRAFT_45161 [Crassisporium funariophilum]